MQVKKVISGSLLKACRRFVVACKSIQKDKVESEEEEEEESGDAEED